MPILTQLAIAGFLFQLNLAAADQPNIVVMMADDMGMGDTGESIKTSLETRMTSRFTPPTWNASHGSASVLPDAHTQSSRCSPTRYGLLTGRYAWRNRLKHWVLLEHKGTR